MKKEIDEIIKGLKRHVEKYLFDQDYEKAEITIRTLAKILYEYNQCYKDDLLEDAIKQLADYYGRIESTKKADPKRVVFYDSFSMDTRGLAYIYLDALGKLGYKIEYICLSAKEWKAPHIEELLNRYKAEIRVIPRFPLMEARNQLAQALQECEAAVAFIYTTPWDTTGIIPFMQINEMNRIFINLTDHAFWLGIDSFDKCICFREYGAEVCAKYRNIKAEKIYILPNYPVVYDNSAFRGLPFDKEEGQVLLCSGGSLYKTIDEKGTFYKLIDRCLENHSNLLFLYIGTGDMTKMNSLIHKYPSRAFCIAERADFIEVLQRADIYLNTFPIGGGLMIQYAALAGRLPLTVADDDDFYGFLPKEIEKKAYFNDIDGLYHELEHMICDEGYRDSLNGLTIEIADSSNQFVLGLDKIMKSEMVAYKPSISGPKVDGFRNKYAGYSMEQMRRDVKYAQCNEFLVEDFPELFYE